MHVNILISVFILIYSTSCVRCLHELCAKQQFENVDCRKQLWGPELSDVGTCEIKYYRINSTECHSMQFSNHVTQLAPLGGVAIKPFYWDYKEAIYVLFNITFTDIKWNHIKFRFQHKVSGNITDLKNYCREITVSPDDLINNSTSLFLNYDCHWSQQHRRYEGEKYYLEYEATGSAGVSKGKYIFIVPSVKTLPPFRSANDWTPFIYLDVLDPQNVYVHIVPPDDSVEVDSYYVNICLQMPRTHRKKQICVDTTLNYVPEKVVTYMHHMISSGWYTFQITPISSKCADGRCKTALGPRIHIVLEQDNLVYTILWAALAFSIFWIPIMLWLAFKWRVKKRSRPNVLIIHPPGNKMDAEVVDLLVKYFKHELHWKLLLKDDIKLTNHDNPYIWCVDAFDKADIILYIVNPYSKDQNEVEYTENNIYTNLDQILLKYIRSGQAKCPIANVLFDHYKARQIPHELIHMKTFRLMKDWYKLLYFVMGYNCWDRLNRNIPKLRSSERGREICTLLNE